jgi:predicted phage tail protein
MADIVTRLNANSGEVTTIRLYGRLGVKFGRVHKLAVGSAAEAVRALCSQLRGLERYLNESKDNGFGYGVFYGKKNLHEDDLLNPNYGDDIRIAPVILGSKNGGWIQVILGVVLVVVGAVLSAYGYGAIGQPLMKLGIGLIVGGVVQLLAPSPKGISARDKPENQASYSFNGPINTQAQGNPYTVIYGDVITGSAVLSAGIDVDDQAYIPSGNPGEGSGGGGGGGAPPWHLEWDD